jgi:hypothetical protein
MPAPDPRAAQTALTSRIDAGLPAATRVAIDDDVTVTEPAAAEDDTRHPFITDSFLRETVGEILDRYGTAFGAAWHADPERLRTEAVALLTRFGAITPVPGGVLVLPLVGRYRNTVAQVRQRALF